MSEIFELSDAAVDRLAAADPILATWYGIGGHDHAWPDLSPEGRAARHDLMTGLRAEARSAPAPDERHQLARDVLVEFCDAAIELYRAGWHHFELNNIESPHQDLRMVFGSQGRDTIDDWEAVLERLEAIQAPIDGYRETLEEGRRAGRVVARRQVEAVIDQGQTTIGPDSSFDELRADLEVAQTGPLAGDGRARGLVTRLDGAIDGAKAAFADLNRYLADTYRPDAAPGDAVGEERYRLAARTFLGTDLDLDQTYRWGWDEVERLWGELRAACATIDPEVPVAEVIDRLRTSPEYAVEHPEELIELMTERQHQALANLDGAHFEVPAPVRDIEVKIEPPGGALAAHYVGPSEDFGRPGTVWYPIAGRRHFPLFDEVTTAYHEGFPGHHLQVGVQNTLGDQLSRFHRMVVWYPGSGEGWALYAEHVMGELGYLERPEYVVGLLSSQLLRACRVAIDIGVHLERPIPDDVTFHPGQRWSFDLAYELLIERALMQPDSARSEVIRYFGWPGQAISYKVGEQAILDLRVEREAAPGFDIKRFHADVLGVGSIGLDLLRRQFDRPSAS